jgi:putative Mg2+ transporter-C (MgtC) family protein
MSDEFWRSFGDPYLVPLARLLVAAACGAMVGWEREVRVKAAGLRTHMLLAIGACLFSLAALRMNANDLTRLVQGMLTGAGFIAAGVIFRQGPSVHGLTTAAGLWVMTGIGMAVGLGEYFLGVVATVFMFFVMSSFRRIEKRIPHRPDGEDQPPK